MFLAGLFASPSGGIMGLQSHAKMLVYYQSFLMSILRIWLLMNLLTFGDYFLIFSSLSGNLFETLPDGIFTPMTSLERM